MTGAPVKKGGGKKRKHRPCEEKKKREGSVSPYDRDYFSLGSFRVKGIAGGREKRGKRGGGSERSVI